MTNRILQTVEYIFAFSALVLFLILIGANEAHAQSVWDQCTDGRSISRCETYDCPRGDTDGNGTCDLNDTDARLTDVRNDSFCSNPLSGCGEVRYFSSGDSNSCSVRVEENNNNCDLYNVSSPTFTPAPTATPTPSPAASSSNELLCSNLITLPSTGKTPLKVSLEIKATGPTSDIKEYEFVLTAPDGSSDGTVVQNSSKLTQTFKETGNHKVVARVVAKDGSKISSEQCQKTVTVQAASSNKLPETGSGMYVGLLFVTLGVFGIYRAQKSKVI